MWKFVRKIEDVGEMFFGWGRERFWVFRIEYIVIGYML